MSLPSTLRAQHHSEILTRLLERARLAFLDAPIAWDPHQPPARERTDVGRAVLDASALGLHVLWTYQEAWGTEGFLALATLDRSVEDLLHQIGHQPNPGLAALGLQHFACRAGVSGTLRRGFKVRSPARGLQSEAVFETLEALELLPEHNLIRVVAWGRTDGTVDDEVSEGASPPLPAPTPATPDDSVSRAIRERLGRGGAAQWAADQAASRARLKLRRMADLATELASEGHTGCEEKLQGLCEELCAALEVASSVQPPSPPTTAQRLMARQLARLERRGGDAVGALEQALACGENESDEAHAARVDAMARFLDSLMVELIQDSRDQIVLLKGASELRRLQRLYSVPSSRFGVAPAGTDQLTLAFERPGGLLPAVLPRLRPGTWLVLGERADDGTKRGTTRWLQGVRVRDARVVEVGGPESKATQIAFLPPLGRSVDLDRLVLLGNVVPISHGETVEEATTTSLDGTTLMLREAPLTWLPSPAAPLGRRPEIDVRVGDRTLHQRPDLLDATHEDLVFAVEPLAQGRTRLRLGDGRYGARVAPGEVVHVRYRIGVGDQGNREEGRIEDPVQSHPLVASTFNPLPSVGGVSPVLHESVRTRAPQALRALDRAVSRADLPALAIQLDGVGRASLAPSRSRRRADVIVSSPQATPLPAADLERVGRTLQARVPPGVDVRTHNASHPGLQTAIVLRISPRADAIDVIRQSRIALGVELEATGEPGLLHPHRTDLGMTVHLSDLYGALEGVPGLDSVLVEAFHRADQAPSLARAIHLAHHERPSWSLGTSGDGVTLRYELTRDR